MELIKSEDILFDWSVAKYLNYTHIDIVDRICDFFTPIGNVDRIEGEVFLCRSAPNCITLDDLPSNMVMRPLSLDNVKAIHDLYPANEIESFQVFERLIEKIPGYGIFTVDGELAAWMVSDNSMKVKFFTEFTGFSRSNLITVQCSLCKLGQNTDEKGEYPFDF